jgi:signal transduction histidine kinase
MSLRLRLLGAFAYVLLLILVALELPLALNLARRIDAEVKNEAAAQAVIVAANASGQMDRATALERLSRQSGRDLGGRVIIVDGRGRLLADSTAAGIPGPLPYASRPEIRTALNAGRAQGERHSDTLGQDLLYTAVPVTNNGRVVGAVRVTQSIDAVHSRIRRGVLALAAIGAFALLVGLVVAWLLASSLSKPLRSLALTARRVEAGDLEARAEVTGPSEQREVAAAFNDMTDRLATVLAAQREFVANASHQLRTPLTGLRLRLESTRAKLGREADAEQEIEAAEREVERLARLLTSLLTLAREGDKPGPSRPVSLARAAERAHERWAVTAEQDGRSLELVGNGEATIAASEEDLAILLDNLIENALRYSPSRVEIDWGREGGEAWLAVLDEGPGLAAGEETQLFERFARGSAGSQRAGTGLGLAIVDTLARRWNGRAALANRLEGGTRAEVRFPAAATLKEEAWVEASS